MLINVQFLRFIAAALVVLYHADSHLRSSGASPGVLFNFAEAVGFAGVDIFFVISGFIMAHTTAGDAGPSDASAFARRRIARIYSGYWPFFLLAVGLFGWIAPERLFEASLVRSAILWPANVLLIAVSWTLVFEMVFYLLYSLLILLPGRPRHYVTLLLLLGFVAWTSHAQFVRGAYRPGALETITLAEYYVLSPYTIEFLAGTLLARGLATRRMSRRGAIAVLLTGTVLFAAGGWVNNHVFGAGIEQGYTMYYRVIVFGLPALLVLAGVVQLDHLGLRAPLRFSLLAGDASYAIYLSHTLLLALARPLGFHAFAASLGSFGAQIAFLLLSAAIVAVSVLYYRTVERPLHRLFRNLLRVA